MGDRVFLEPLITQDPTPANEWDIQPSRVRSSDANTYTIGSSLEKVLWIDDRDVGRGSVFEVVAIGSIRFHIKDPVSREFDSLTLFAKWAPYYSLEHEFLMSFAAQIDLPTGNTGIQESSHTSLGPVFLWEKGMGDLPNSSVVKYLRFFAIQTDFGYVPALGGPARHAMFADATIEYSLPYLSNNVQDIGLKWPLRSIFFFTEINYNQLITGPPGETFLNLLATPGIAYLSYHFQVSIDTQFALNSASVPGTHAAVLGLLDIFYDSLFRVGNWTINRGMPR